MAFLTEPEPARGVAIDVLPGIRRVVARNPGVMTYHGTNTYLLDREDGITVIDPGPADERHVQEVVNAAGGKPIIRIVVTHAHRDHHGAVAALQQATGAPSWGYARSGTPHEFTADHGLDDGAQVAGLEAIHTPGHAVDHLSFAYSVPGVGRILFSGDHVMAWSSSIVNPPLGDMRAYYQSLTLVLERDDAIYLPGHGPMERNPKPLVRALLAHRQMREAAILKSLNGGARSVADIATQLYGKTNEHLQIAAERNVLAHLLKLRQEGRVTELGDEPSIPSSMPSGENIGDKESQLVAYHAMARRDAVREFRKA